MLGVGSQRCFKTQDNPKRTQIPGDLKTTAGCWGLKARAGTHRHPQALLAVLVPSGRVTLPCHCHKEGNRAAEESGTRSSAITGPGKKHFRGSSSELDT